MKVDRIIHSSDIQMLFHSKFLKIARDRLLNLVQPEVDPSIRQPPKPYPRTKHEVDWITCCSDIPDFSLRMRTSATFLLPAEVLVTVSESHTPFPIHL